MQSWVPSTSEIDHSRFGAAMPGKQSSRDHLAAASIFDSTPADCTSNALASAMLVVTT
jgi:hypothetical protein